MRTFLYVSVFIEQIFYRLLYMSIVASIIGVIIFIITRFLKNKISPKWISRIWLLFIISLIIPIQFKSPFSIYNIIPKDLDSTINNVTSARDSFLIQPQLDNIDNTFNIYLNGKINAKEITKEEANEITKTFEKDYEKFYETYSYKNLVNFIPLVWLILVLGIVLVYIIIYISFVFKINKTCKEDERLNSILDKCKTEMNIKRKIKIFYQDVIDMPSIFGLFKIKILINNDSKKLDDKELTYIIKHELAHYKRKDNWLNFWISILRCVYIFNPIVFFCLRKVKKDLELATDEVATRDFSADEQKEYLKTLVILSENKPVKFLVQTLCLSDEKKNLERRIDTLKLFEKFKKNSKQIAIVSIVICCILIVTCFTKGKNYINKNDIRNMLASVEEPNFSNCYIKEIERSKDGSIKSQREIYRYDDKIKVIKKYKEDNGVLTTQTNYYNISENNFFTIEDELGRKEIQIYNDEYYETIEDENKSLKRRMTNNFYKCRYDYIPNVDGEDCYVIKEEGLKFISFNENLKLGIKPFINEIYISSNTGLIKKETYEYSAMRMSNYSSIEYFYEFGNVTEEDFKFDISGYTDSKSDYYTFFIDFYEVKNQILQSNDNKKDALDSFTMLENLSEEEWEYSYSDKYYLLNNEYVFDLIFNNYDNDEYYKLTIEEKNKKIVKLESRKLNENKELIITTKDF